MFFFLFVAFKFDILESLLSLFFQASPGAIAERSSGNTTNDHRCNSTSSYPTNNSSSGSHTNRQFLFIAISSMKRSFLDILACLLAIIQYLFLYFISLLYFLLMFSYAQCLLPRDLIDSFSNTYDLFYITFISFAMIGIFLHSSYINDVIV